jgi:hypothetical protein
MDPLLKSVHLTLQLNPGQSIPDDELDLQTRQLLGEIREMEVESAQLVTDGESPAGSKSGELVTLGSLAVVVLPTIAPKLVELLQSWSLRAENRTVKVKAQVADRSIEVEYSPATMSTDELKRLVSSLSEALPPATKS